MRSSSALDLHAVQICCLEMLSFQIFRDPPSSDKCQDYFRSFPSLHESWDLMNLENKLLQDHPIGYTISAHTSIIIMELFFGMYFRPWDFYVIHLEKEVILLPVWLIIPKSSWNLASYNRWARRWGSKWRILLNAIVNDQTIQTRCSCSMKMYPFMLNGTVWRTWMSTWCASQNFWNWTTTTMKANGSMQFTWLAQHCHICLTWNFVWQSH